MAPLTRLPHGRTPGTKGGFLSHVGKGPFEPDTMKAEAEHGGSEA